MFEGKELEKKIGEYGSVSVDVTPQLKLKVSLEVEVDLVAEAKKLAVQTGTPVDDLAIAWLERLQASAKAA